VVWKHIGLHGHSVGTFTADPAAIQWKSAMMGASDDDDIVTSRLIPPRSVASAQWTVFGRSGHIRIQQKPGGGSQSAVALELRFDGFPPTDYDKVRKSFQRLYNVDVTRHSMSSCGASFGNTDLDNRNLVFRQCILEDNDEEGMEVEPQNGDEMMSLQLAEVSQCVLPGNNRNEIELQFHESDTVEAGTDQLVGVRIYIPPDPDMDPQDNDVQTPAEILQQRIMKMANIKNTTGSVIVEFDESRGTFLTPRGRYTIELYDSFLRMRGNKYDYKIKYDDISKLFLLPKPDDVHMAFVIALDKPIRQGQQRYQMLVMQTTKEQSEVSVNLDEETLQSEYGGDLQPMMYGALSNLVAKTFKVIAKKKVFIPGKFANANQQACVKCALRANEGHLYPLEKQFVFIHKPPVLVRFDEVESVEFQRYAGGQGSTRNFDLCVTLLNTSGDTGSKEYVFSGIDRSDYTGLYNFLSGKKIKINNFQGVGMEDAPRGNPVYNEDEIYGVKAAEGEESSEDEDYDEKAAAASSSEESGSEDDDQLDSDLDDSDLDEHRRNAGITKPKKEKKEKKEKNESSNKRSAPDSDDDSEDDVASQKTSKSEKSDSSKKKAKKPKKDPNAPKKPTSSYLFFSKDIRPKMKEKYPDASFGELNKAIGAEFKNLSQDGMKKYNDLAKKEKERYKKEMSNYVPPSSDSDNDDESDDEKPQKGGKAKKDPNAPKKNMSAYMFFSNVKRKELKKSRPDLKFGDIARAISVEYKKLSPDELKEFEDMAKADKRRYAKDMEGYTPPPKSEKSEKTPTKKAKKDPNAPKKPMTSFMYYSTENRSRVKKENPDASFGEIAKIIGLKFRELDGEELKKYTSKASADKERYRKAMEKYEGAPKSPKASDSSNTSKKKKKAKVEVPPESESESDDSSAASDSGSGSDDSDSDSDSD